MKTLNSQTTAAPNSWATVSLWRRFFQLKDEQEDEMLDVVARALEAEISEREVRPIHCEDVVAARREFLREHYQHVIAPSNTQPNIGSLAANAAQEQHQTRVHCHQEQQVHRPNLQVPVRSNADLPESVYLAQ